MNRRWLAAIVFGLAAALLLLWLVRAQFAAEIARRYFRSHGVESQVEIGALGLSGVSGRFALGPADAPDLAADHIELRFDPLGWTPRLVEVRLVHPVMRAQIGADGKPHLGSLQTWIDSLGRQQGKSRFVSDDLAVSLTGLRLLLATPGGALEIDGDARLVKNLPVALVLSARPATLAYQGARVMLRAASLNFDAVHGVFAARFSGAVQGAGMEGRDVEAQFDTDGLTWDTANNRLLVNASSARLQVHAASLASALSVAAPTLDLTARNIHLASAAGQWDAKADLAGTAGAGLDIALPALRAADPALADALRQNLAHLELGIAGHLERQDGKIRFTLAAPLTLKGAHGGLLRLPMLAVSGTSDSLNASLDAALSGPGLPTARLALRNLVWTGGGFTSDAALAARFGFAMLRGADIAADGALSWQSGRYAFTPKTCARAALAAFHPGASDLARNIRAAICPLTGKPLITGEGAHWILSGAAHDASADLPLANVHADHMAATLAFTGDGAPQGGTATVTAAEISDRAPGPRFQPLAGSGAATLANGVWRGRFAVTGPKNSPLGETSFLHTMASGIGSAHITAPNIAFAPDHLQPVDLSPFLVALRRAEGAVAFTGDIGWTRNTITSRGRLSVAALDFLTPLGKAHAVKTDIALSSLLPPITAPGQAIAIARIDWTLPFSAVDLLFAFSPAAIHLDKADTDIAQGHASLGALTVNLADPGHLAGAAQLNGIALSALVAASNLGSKVKLDGKISGRVPFILGPEGFRIAGGHVAADGPGRLSVDRALWVQGDAALNSNAVQDFAYQALENLAFESLSAELNSVAGGRLQIVFHIKGRSDPPKPQVAEVAITDILNGTALYKPIPLPSGTPIDLTLDTSLNFDELLKSYAEAWSKTLNPVGAPAAPGAKP